MTKVRLKQTYPSQGRVTLPEVVQRWQMRLGIFNYFILNSDIFQIELFNGEDNILTMNQTHSKKFHCIYLLHYYPFDTQVSCQYESSTLDLFTRLAV